MGKKDKEHRAKVAKRNKRINQEKSGMQKAFDKLMEEQIQKLKNNEGLNVDLSGSTVPFEVFDKDHLDSIVDFKGKHPELIMGNEEELPFNI
jgi:Skp family chaperone for outer membrane proteins